MTIQVLKVPYDSGHRCERMARGPGYLLSNKILDQPTVESIETTFQPEVQSTFDLARQLSARVRALHDAGALAVILSGNCSSSIGTIAGLGTYQTGVLWFDAHGEFNTPETTQSGFFDGMSLSVATGHCWRKLADSIPHFSPVPEENIILVGVRDTDPDEQTALDGSGITQVRDISLLGPVLERVATHVEQWYVHLDLDSLDPSEATANQWVPPSGLRAHDIARAIEHAVKLHPLAAITIASLDPAIDADGRALAISRTLLRTAIAANAAR